MYVALDEESYEYTYPELYIMVDVAKSKTALNGTYGLYWAGVWMSENDSVVSEEGATTGSLTIQNVGNEGQYSFKGSFVATNGKTYTFNETVDVWAFDYDNLEEILKILDDASKDNLIHEVTATVNDLVSVNRNQKDRIIVLEERIEQLSEANRMLTDKTREQARDYEKLKTSVENYRTIVGKLEAKNSALEAKNHDQERTILRLSDENKNLRSELLNNDALAQVLADARSALGSGNELDSSEEYGYYRRAA